MSISTSMIFRVEIDNAKITFGEIATAVNGAGGDVVAVDIIRAGKDVSIRDITVQLNVDMHQQVIDKVQSLQGTRIIHVSDSTFLAHLGGKIQVMPKSPIKNREDLSRVYTPGVARVCMAIHEDPSKAFTLTVKRNTVAIVTDGTAVLGLGDIGPEAAMPVMEGKAMLFKQFADVDAFPICLQTKDVDEIVRIVKAISPTFGGINLEDISSPRCFEIERRLQDELNIPVFHDDQHGTAVVILAGLFNALRLVGKSVSNIRVVVCGVGAAGAACIEMLLAAGVRNLIAVDRCGALVPGVDYNHPTLNRIAAVTNSERKQGKLGDVIVGADVFIGVSGPGVLTTVDIKQMAQDPIVFAMANPEPEIDPEIAEPLVRVLATGRSDYPNQINNVLCFPGMFRGALDCRASRVNEEMKLAAARAIASIVTEEELNEQYIIPSIFNEKVVLRVRDAVIEAALKTGVAKRIPPEFQSHEPHGTINIVEDSMILH
ncbi:NAD-dependent malic enzyme [Paenibacillus sp. GP183]|jgi:malate dehydrogenase (oxaloacetate-decarboxylating)|uniref:NAD-dependent malic enzyme n=1 Tax=Paenibacillus sp. GP183 TaxID=1882751 RepID=UPI00089628C1|nr:NAD-dependent malic enzyme [Paenibacillus sp. GP183]SEB72173.1 malate dehydrogenase (oxaloacetate-decarboxylating) [Paenibacillus sp. GP183]